ncbi:hypothetical protein EVAR_48463_1 [Eumeta japonica]|uniref:Uncharacterized protein n=1 Tax=Eumeta variegata TaxID=151549 RepID=A0A4C1XGR7_EUMVA|nr:hypothetical protein EVAR_48463_1 [Eumeta japonica]
MATDKSQLALSRKDMQQGTGNSGISRTTRIRRCGPGAGLALATRRLEYFKGAEMFSGDLKHFLPIPRTICRPIALRSGFALTAEESLWTRRKHVHRSATSAPLLIRLLKRYNKIKRFLHSQMLRDMKQEIIVSHSAGRAAGRRRPWGARSAPAAPPVCYNSFLPNSKM